MKKCFFNCSMLLFSIFAKADSLDIKIGQMIMMGMSGTSVSANSSIIQDIKSGKVGGVLLFEYNLDKNNTKTKLQKLTDDLQNAASTSLFISIDQEGGKVNRLKMKYGFPAMPSAKVVGDKNNDAYSKFVASTISNSCAEVGINLNYAPVMDIHNSTCPVIGKLERSFSCNPKTIAHIGEIYIDAHHENGVKTVLKHFPGHGNSKTDSHLGIADVSNYWSDKELLPYKILIAENKVDAIMTAHIINNKLDNKKIPSTLSYKIVTELLREKLKFNGVVISDDMQMGAIAKQYGFEESIKMAINAGIDILIFSNNIPGASKYSTNNVHATIKKLVEKGEIKEERINESYLRIMAMKKSR
ncbi:MAG: hypothetical protein KA275_04845 [Chitinophagaceae bacterium]|nr:hypothetical protein [Chitinophagaceae bacterium]